MLLTPKEIPNLLRSAKTVAVVGISDKPDRPSFGVSQYLLENSEYEIFFVNPLVDEVLGKQVYKTLKDIPVHIDIVDVFRKAEDCPSVLEKAIAIKASTIWLQLGISNDEVAEKGTTAGMKVVMDRCIKIDYDALIY